MGRKMLLVAAAIAMPMVFITASAGTASAGKVVDVTGAPATANCSPSGGTMTFKHGIGLSGGSYVFPTKNKGNQIKVAGVNLLDCTSSAVTGTFTGILSGNIKLSNPSASPATFYACPSPDQAWFRPTPGGTVSGTLKIKWSSPAGQKFGGGSKTLIDVTSVAGAFVTGVGGPVELFEIPASPGTGSIAGSFPGDDGGASMFLLVFSVAHEAALTAQCMASGGLTSVDLAAGGLTLQ